MSAALTRLWQLRLNDTINVMSKTAGGADKDNQAGG